MAPGHRMIERPGLGRSRHGGPHLQVGHAHFFTWVVVRVLFCGLVLLGGLETSVGGFAAKNADSRVAPRLRLAFSSSARFLCARSFSLCARLKARSSWILNYKVIFQGA